MRLSATQKREIFSEMIRPFIEDFNASLDTLSEKFIAEQTKNPDLLYKIYPTPSAEHMMSIALSEELVSTPVRAFSNPPRVTIYIPPSTKARESLPNISAHLDVDGRAGDMLVLRAAATSTGYNSLYQRAVSALIQLRIMDIEALMAATKTADLSKLPQKTREEIENHVEKTNSFYCNRNVAIPPTPSVWAAIGLEAEFLSFMKHRQAFLDMEEWWASTLNTVNTYKQLASIIGPSIESTLPQRLRTEYEEYETAATARASLRKQEKEKREAEQKALQAEANKAKTLVVAKRLQGKI